MTTERETILIIDDEELVRQVIRRKLSSEGYHCLEAANADQALDELKRNAIELAILDIKMPGKSGIELLPEIKEHYPDTVVVMATIIADTNTVIQCMRQGVFDYISKPLNLDEVVLSVGRALEMRRLRLIESDKQYRTVFESANDVLLSLDRRGKILDVNEKLKELGGYEKEDLIGKNIRSLTKMMSKKSLVVVAKNFLKRMAGINVPPYEVEMVTKSGELLTVEINAVAIRREGKVIGDLAILRNVTEHKKAEKALRESEEKWRSLTGNTDDTIVVTDNNDVIRYINRTIPPTTPEGVIGKTIYEYVSEENHNIMRESLKRVYKKREPDSYEVALDMSKIDPEIGTLWFRTKVVPIKTDKQVVGTIMVATDITERKRAEEVLRESEERYRTVIQDAHDMIQSVRPDGSFIFANPAWLQTLGYTEEDLPGLNMFNIIHPESLAHCQELFTKVMVGEAVQDISATFTAKDGRKILVEGNATPRYIGDNVVATQGIFRDVTERKRAEEEIKQLYEQLKTFNIELEEKIKERTKELEVAVKDAEAANQAKSEFLSGMSHELRTPLTAIIGFSQVLTEQYFGELNEKQAEYVKDILESGEHLLSLINDILDLAKVEAGKAELELSSVNMKELLESSLVMIKEKALKHSLSLEARLSSVLDNLLIIADQRKLKQVMFNLLSNAAKFTPDHGRITVEAGREGEEIMVSITDTGIGIALKDQGNIFDEFYQVRSGAKDKTPGTGLGLPLSKHFIEMHGGRIWVESEGKSKGSRFIFSLPIREANQDKET